MGEWTNKQIDRLKDKERDKLMVKKLMPFIRQSRADKGRKKKSVG